MSTRPAKHWCSLLVPIAMASGVAGCVSNASPDVVDATDANTQTDVANDGSTSADTVTPPDAGDGAVASDAADAASRPSAPVLGPELLANPGFESGLMSWEDYGSNMVVSDARTGTSAERLGTIAGGLLQRVPVVAGTTYRVSAYAKADTGNEGPMLRYSMHLPDGTDSERGIAIFSSVYERLTADFTVPAGVTSVSVFAWTNASTGYAYLDDFSLRTVVPSAPLPVLVDEGDSISAEGHSHMYAASTPDIAYFDEAVGGSGLDMVESRRSLVLAHRPSQGQFVVTLLIGANDLAANDPNAYATRLFAYCDAVRAAGASVALGTVLPQSVDNFVVHNQKRLVLNDLIRASVGVHIDAVIDYASDSVIGPDAAAMDTALYRDGLHPTTFPGGCQERMFRLYRAAVDGLIVR